MCVQCLGRPEEGIASSGTGAPFVSGQVVLGTEFWYAALAASVLSSELSPASVCFLKGNLSYAHMRNGTEEEPVTKDWKSRWLL